SRTEAERSAGAPSSRWQFDLPCRILGVTNASRSTSRGARARSYRASGAAGCRGAGPAGQRRVSQSTEDAMAIKAGDRLPDGTLTEMIDTERPGCTVGPNAFSVGEITKGKKIAIFGLPG